MLSGIVEISVNDSENNNDNSPNEQDVNEVELVSEGSNIVEDSSLCDFIRSEILQENIPGTGDESFHFRNNDFSKNNVLIFNYNL